jgi:aryl-alcohol dehydrogenase-like predicted oxidoreductase
MTSAEIDKSRAGRSAARRKLGRSGIEVSAMGLGCWAISGSWTWDGRQAGWGKVDDEESVRAIRRAIDLGVDFFDLGDCYGSGHGERVLGKAIASRTDEVVVSTKFGSVFEEGRPEFLGEDASPAYIRKACQASLRRLGLERIDLYSLEIWSLPRAQAEEVAGTLDELRTEGLIGAYGWSTDDLDCARLFAARPGCAAIEHDLNVFRDAPELLALCDEHDLASVNRAPLAMGLLSGKFSRDSKLPDDDVRGRQGPEGWFSYFRDGRPAPELIDRIEAVREVLTSGGRTLVQGALAWIWARSERTIPIPGFKTVAQVEENARALEHGPLGPAEMDQIGQILQPPA